MRIITRGYGSSLDIPHDLVTRGFGPVVPTPSAIPMGGSGYPVYGPPSYLRKRKTLDSLVSKWVDEIYAELHPAPARKEVVAAVEPFVVQEESPRIDWSSLRKDAKAVREILRLYNDLREMEDEDEEEIWMMLH